MGTLSRGRMIGSGLLVLGGIGLIATFDIASTSTSSVPRWRWPRLATRLMRNFSGHSMTDAGEQAYMDSSRQVCVSDRRVPGVRRPTRFHD